MSWWVCKDCGEEVTAGSPHVTCRETVEVRAESRQIFEMLDVGIIMTRGYFPRGQRIRAFDDSLIIGENTPICDVTFIVDTEKGRQDFLDAVKKAGLDLPKFTELATAEGVKFYSIEANELHKEIPN